MEIKRRFIENLDQLACLPGYHWELIAAKHSDFILAWRNDPENLRFFEGQDSLTIEKQADFLNRYDELDRVDLVLVKDVPLGVFNIKNLTAFPEYGALIGSLEYRGKGLGFQVKKAIFDYWFNVIGMDRIYIKNRLINENGISSNLKIGFKQVGLDEQFVTLELSRQQFNQDRL